tara:strand:- start:909 stop:1820 length:912 start_codon:yes stop_codon:yes gene_type:complete
MKKKVLPVIVLFCYNRVSHLKKTIYSLMNNYNFKNYQLIIFSDGPKNKSDLIKIKKVREYLSSLKSHKIKVCKNKKNLGLKKNIILQLNKIFKEHEMAIIVEDDILTNKYFLNYMTEALLNFKKRKKIGSISAYTPINYLKMKKFNFDLYYSKRHYSWGWGTWSNRWNNFVFDEKKIVKKINKKNIEKFDSIGRDLPILLDLSLKNKISSWSIYFDFNCLVKNLSCVCPKFSLVKNLGFDESGTHEHQNFLNNEIKINWRPINFNKINFSNKIALLEKKSINGDIKQKIKNKFFRLIKMVYRS